jgi:hypothetical protein
MAEKCAVKPSAIRLTFDFLQLESRLNETQIDVLLVAAVAPVAREKRAGQTALGVLVANEAFFLGRHNELAAVVWQR